MSRSISKLKKLKMWIDYLKYMSFLQKEETLKLIVDISIFALSLYLLQHELLLKIFGEHKPGEHGEAETGFLSFIAILIIIKFIWESYSTKEHIKSFFHIQHSILRNPVNIASMLPSEKEIDNGFKSVEIPGKKPDSVFVSDKLNQHLRTTPFFIHYSSHKKKHIKDYLQLHGDILLQYLNYYFFSSLKANQEFTNEEKLCLSKDLKLNSKEVTCHTGGYYDSFLTNQIVGTTLVIKDKKHTTITTEHIFPSHEDEEGNLHLTGISESQMNHHIGVSTLGFSSDNKLIIWEQGPTTQFNNSRLVPTGSGSVNATDAKSNNFQKAITNGMERELTEESNPVSEKASSNYKTMILGFYRWVSRGGKPEFVGITKLPGKAEDYKPTNREIKDRIHHYFEIKSIDDLEKVINQIRLKDNLSLPLHMCLKELENMHKNNKEDLRRFLFN